MSVLREVFGSYDSLSGLFHERPNSVTMATTIAHLVAADAVTPFRGLLLSHKSSPGKLSSRKFSQRMQMFNISYGTDVKGILSLFRYATIG